MAGAIAHRGPDDEGFFQAVTRDGLHEIGLAHRRLSIIDLSTGHQPIGNEDGSVQIVFNGEIYNFEPLRDELIAAGHAFRTKSDTESLLQLFAEKGAACLSELEGMFAFAIWDRERRVLSLARDRLGEKPLYYGWFDGTLLFGSELKALRAHPAWRPGS